MFLYIRIACLLTIMFFALLGCVSIEHGARNVPADSIIFTNSTGDDVVITDNGIIVDNRKFARTDCSTTNMNCVIFKGFGVFISPKKCFQSKFFTHHVAGYKAEMVAVGYHFNRQIYMTSASDKMAYNFEDEPGNGIVEIQYDPTGSMHLDDRSLWVKNSSAAMARASYWKRSGAAFLACHN